MFIDKIQREVFFEALEEVKQHIESNLLHSVVILLIDNNYKTDISMATYKADDIPLIAGAIDEAFKSLYYKLTNKELEEQLEKHTIN
jgi:hypothetical protein